MKKCKMPQSRAGTGTTSSKKKISRMTLTGILSLAAVFFMVISVQAKNETATENNDTPIMKMAQITTKTKRVNPATYFVKGSSITPVLAITNAEWPDENVPSVLASRNEAFLLDSGISITGNFSPTEAVFFDSQIFTAESLGGGHVFKMPVLISSFGIDPDLEGGEFLVASLANSSDGSGSSYSHANGFAEKGVGNLNVTVIV